MTIRFVIATAFAVTSTLPCAVPVLAGADLPVKDGRPVVAVVNGESIFLDEFTAQLEPPIERARLLQGRGKATELELLDRLVIVRLLAQEAATMGLADLPEIRKQVDVESRTILRDVLRDSIVEDLQPDEAAVEKLFKELVKEYRTTSLLFGEEASATRVRKEIADGGDYAEIAARVLAEKTARAEGDDTYHRQKDYLPQIGEALGKMDVGQISPVIHVEAGFVIVRVVDIRYPDSPEYREEARKKVAGQQRVAALRTYEETLRSRYVVVNKALLESLDYEAKEPGIDALLKDTRVVAEVKGGSPVTVGDLTDDLRMQVFHRGDQAGQGKRLNARKDVALDGILGRRVMNLEARRLGMDKTDAYLDRVNAFEESLVFNAFVQKVIAPESKVAEAEIKRYYTEHLKEYSSPEMMRIRSLAFATRGAAEEAIRKLGEGADYSWLVATAEGQVDKGTEGLLNLDGRPVTTASMPGEMQKALAASRAGESRLYASPEGYFYVLSVQDVIASDARSYDDVKGEIAKRLYGEKLKKGVEDYAAKLRALSKVETYLEKVQ